MAIINQASKELQIKIVYYGPALGGKTTNLVQVHDHVQTAQGNKGKLVSLATSSDRTLFFDFLPIEAMAIKGFKTKFQLYTVPGQVIYNTTRQLVLRGVDGIVFVADSQYEKMEENVQSFSNLEENLKSLNLNLADIPYVGPVLFEGDLMIFAALPTALLVWWALYRTRWGLALRTVGESRVAAYAAGLNPERIQYQALFVGGLLGGMGGAHLSLAYARVWVDQMTAGRGFIAVALVIFAS